jgi:putative component of membrane protein insertase Oxa1/YidC/SpoIIIJ protein YidD
MALLKVMVPLTGMLEVLTGPQFNRFVETCSTYPLEGVKTSVFEIGKCGLRVARTGSRRRNIGS